MTQASSRGLSELLEDIIRLNASKNSVGWLKERANSAAQLYPTFAMMARRMGKNIIRLEEEQRHRVALLRSGFRIDGWPVDRLSRVWLLLNVDASDKEQYFAQIETLFRSADVNELVALYSALPVLHYPESWTFRCSEGIRSNIGDVLSAIMCNNPYPSEHLDEPAWNQLVLKAFFTDKPVHKIIGLDARANKKLASTLSDYAHERWAADRRVNPQLWRLVAPFTDQVLFSDLERLAASPLEVEREAAMLACHDAQYPEAKKLFDPQTNIGQAISSGKLTWNALAEKLSDYVLQQ